MGLAAGRLRERISIRRKQDAQTAAGGQARSWVPRPGMTDVPAEILSQSGRESVIANTLQGIATYRITIRWREGIEASDQVLWKRKSGDVELNILAPPADPTGRREMLQILADTSAPQNAK